MAGFDLETQRHAKTIGMCFDAGRFDFSSGSATCDVPTCLAGVLMGLASADVTAVPAAQQTPGAYRVGDVSNGAVTFVRAGGALDEDARMSYILAGW